MSSHRVRDTKTGRFARIVEAIRRPDTTVTETAGVERTYRVRKDFATLRDGDLVIVSGRGIRTEAGATIAVRE